MFGEEIIDFEDDSFPGTGVDDPLISGQLITQFVDGLKSDSIAKNIIQKSLHYKDMT